jgi:hypothetical protein
MRAILLLTLLLALGAHSARAEDRRIEVAFTPVARAQLAIWLESADRTRFATVRLTNAVAFRGIGNRPGALQMNSAFRWPYGRREGVLPVWAHRRVASGAQPFPRVIFSGRVSEGNASSAGSGAETVNTRDDYFCLSFRDGDESLDAVSCASVFMSNKGRYMTVQDVQNGYSEPREDGGIGRMAPLSLDSLYPPRQDLAACASCPDHADVRRYRDDATTIMPELDAVSMATPPGGSPFEVVYYVPQEWPDGEYFAYVEVNTEGDYAPDWDSSAYPTPRNPARAWDTWAISYGYPYRGQPSVVYRVPFTLGAGGSWSATEPVGFGDLAGDTGDMAQMNATILDDHEAHPGSGADRIFAGDGGARVKVVVPSVDVCAQAQPPPECGVGCMDDASCNNARLVCGPAASCVDMCDVPRPPSAPQNVTLLDYPDFRRTHEWVRLRFDVPPSSRGLRRYEVRVGTQPITDLESFMAARPAQAATIDDQALVVPTDGGPGAQVEVDLGGLASENHYYIGIRAFDRECDDGSAIATAEYTTTAIRFTTVSPCFVATAAYGSPLDQRIGVLRRFRDRHLLTHAAGQALVHAYYRIGSTLANAIGGSPWRRSVARSALEPLVALAEWLDQGSTASP